MTLWLLALVGALCSWGADVLCVLAVRRSAISLMLLGFVLYGLCAPLWWTMSKLCKGSYFEPAIIWTVVSTTLSLVAIAVLDGNIGWKQWLAFGLITSGLLVKSV